MIDFDNQTKLNIDLDKLEHIADTLSSTDVELILTDDETMQALNKAHRGKASSTDVLSFPLERQFIQESVLGMPLGSIVITQSYVVQKAKELGHSIQDEVSLLFIHGMLHLLGFDHEKDNGEMRQKEESLIIKFDLPKSLIVRTGE